MLSGMKKILFVTVLLSMIGCGGESSDSPRATPTDAAVDYGDACVMAQGNCGCIFEEDYNFQTKQIVTTVVCPER